MKVRMFIGYTVMIVVANLLTATPIFSQQASDHQAERKNTISLTVSLNEFFDGNQLWQSARPGTMRWVNLTYGLAYDRMLSDLHGLTFALRSTNIHYFSPNLKFGQTFERTNLSLDAYYRPRFFTSSRTNVYGCVGLSLRYGAETVFYHKYFNESIIYSFDLFDPGILVGGRLTHALRHHFILSTELRFIEYVYRPAVHDFRNPGDFPNRPTRHLLSLQAGIGYQF